MTAPSGDDAGKAYQFVAEYITAKNYPPSEREIATAMGWPKWRSKPALEALQQAGKIRLIPGRDGNRHRITLTALPTQHVARSTSPAEKASVKAAIPKPGQIICVQCRNPVCEKSKWYCDLHLRLNREAAKRCLDKKRKAGICLQCDVRAGPVSCVFCESHRKKCLEATARCRARIGAKARRERSMDTYNLAHPHAKMAA
jgi:hypothetical protein